jgi:hypothetical protein
MWKCLYEKTICERLARKKLNQKIILQPLFVELFFILPSFFTKEKEVFMQSTDSSWKPSVGIA